MNLCFCEFAFVLVELRKAHMAGMSQCVWLRGFCGRFELILEDTLRFTKSVLLLVHLCEAVAREVQTGGIIGRLRFGHRRQIQSLRFCQVSRQPRVLRFHCKSLEVPPLG